MIASPSSARYVTRAFTCGSVIVAMDLLSLRMSLDESAEENARHEIGQPVGIDGPGWIVPVVDPVHHAEEDVGRGAPVHRVMLGRGFFQNRLEQIDVAPLDSAHRPRRGL